MAKKSEMNTILFPRKTDKLFPWLALLASLGSLIENLVKGEVSWGLLFFVFLIISSIYWLLRVYQKV